MKRTILIMMIALICATSQAQVNPKMQQLFDKLTELDEAPRIVKSGGKDRPVRFDYSVHLYYSPNMYLGVDSLSLDSILCEDRNHLAQQLSVIRHTLDELQAEAAESYHYEYHKEGSDTIVYSMNLCRDTTRYASKHHNANHPTFYSDEYLYFNCQPYHDEDEVRATLQYTVHAPNPGPQAEKNRLESLTSDIARLFTQNKIKPRMAMWRTTKHIPTRYIPWTQKISNHAPSLGATAWRASPMHRYSQCHVSRKRKPASSTMRYRGWLCNSQKETWMSCTATII